MGGEGKVMDCSHPEKPIKSDMVPTVKSAMMYIPRAWTSATIAL